MAFKILSLDGGGSWALLEAMALGQLYGPTTPGLAILGHFDLAAANSGGSIILAGLALDFSPQKLIDLLNSLKLREKIFVKRFLSFGLLERYDAAAKLPGLSDPLVLGNASNQFLNQLNPAPPCKLLISTFNYDRLREEFFRSDVRSPAATSAGGPQPTLAEAVHASTNAPIKYFNKPAEFNTQAFAGKRYWDGGVGGFNNPAMAAVAEALAYGQNPTDIRVLSIGTGSVYLPLPDPPLPAPGASGQNRLCTPIESSALMPDLIKMATTIVDDPPDQASFVAHLVTSGAGALSQNPAQPATHGNFVRLNPWIQPVGGPAAWRPPVLRQYAQASNLTSVTDKFADDAGIFNALVNLDMDAVEQPEVDLITTLGLAWLAGDVPNQSIRATSDLRSLIGHPTFASAQAQARILTLL